MKKLLLVPILLFAFDASAMEHLDEAQELYEQSEASKVDEASQSSCAVEQQEDEYSESVDKYDSDSDDYTWHSDLDEVQWVERYGCKYCPAGGCKQTEMFDCNGLLKNPYWQKVMKMQQEEKDDVLAKTMKSTNTRGDYWYHHRCHMAAAVCAGANPNTKSKEEWWERPLHSPLMLEDPPLTKLLLEHGADPELNVSHSPLFRHSAICDALTLEEAELLFEYGVNPHASCQNNTSVLHQIMTYHPTDSAELVDLYLSKGVDPNVSKNLNYTPFISLAICTTNFTPKQIRHIGKALIKHGADLTTEISEKADSRLHAYSGLHAEGILTERWFSRKCQNNNENDACRGIDALLEVIQEAKEKQSKG